MIALCTIVVTPFAQYPIQKSYYKYKQKIAICQVSNCEFVLIVSYKLEPTLKVDSNLLSLEEEQFITFSEYHQTEPYSKLCNKALRKNDRVGLLFLMSEFIEKQFSDLMKDAFYDSCQ